jgi:hypothetical protein
MGTSFGFDNRFYFEKSIWKKFIKLEPRILTDNG